MTTKMTKTAAAANRQKSTSRPLHRNGRMEVVSRSSSESRDNHGDSACLIGLACQASSQKFCLPAGERKRKRMGEIGSGNASVVWRERKWWEIEKDGNEIER